MCVCVREREREREREGGGGREEIRKTSDGECEEGPHARRPTGGAWRKVLNSYCLLTDETIASAIVSDEKLVPRRNNVFYILYSVKGRTGHFDNSSVPTGET